MALTEQTKEWVYLGATGLVPTFLHYTDDAGVAVSQPTISEEANGYYSFDYGTVTQTIHWAFNPVGEVDHAFNTIYLDSLSIDEKDDIVDAVWDEVINNSNHNGAQSAGKRLRQAGSLVAAEGECVGTPTASSFTTDLTQTTSSFYADQTLVFLSGNLTGEARVITSYDGSTKIVTFDEAFALAPVATDEFAIFADHVHPVSQIANATLAKVIPHLP